MSGINHWIYNTPTLPFIWLRPNYCHPVASLLVQDWTEHVVIEREAAYTVTYECHTRRHIAFFSKCACSLTLAIEWLNVTRGETRFVKTTETQPVMKHWQTMNRCSGNFNLFTKKTSLFFQLVKEIQTNNVVTPGGLQLGELIKTQRVIKAKFHRDILPDLS